MSFTEGAIAEIKRLMQAEGFDKTQKLRVGVENDFHFIASGVDCVMEKAHEIYLLGMQIDWQDGLNSRGFTFKNPNASATCGCGTSFAV